MILEDVLDKSDADDSKVTNSVSVNNLDSGDDDYIDPLEVGV